MFILLRIIMEDDTEEKQWITKFEPLWINARITQ